MAARYMPQVGDVVRYKGMTMVVVLMESKETMEHLSYDRTYYLLDESLVNCSSPVSVEDLSLQWISVEIKPQMSKLPRFTKIATSRYDIKEISYLKISKKD